MLPTSGSPAISTAALSRGQAADDAGEPLELAERPTAQRAAALRLLLHRCRDSNGLGDRIEDR